MFKKIIKIIFMFIVLISIGLLTFTLMQKPTHDKNWEKQSALLPKVTITDNILTLENVRDFTYSTSTVLSDGYITRTIPLTDIEKMYFIVDPFSSWKAVAHTFLTFDIKNQEPITLSVEARREESTDYSAIKGLFNQYELWYAWGQERDMIARRSVYYNEPLNMYELQIQPETAQKIFLSLIQETHELETHPKFYNTVFDNCSNELARISNNINPHSIPFHYSYVLTGYADEYLYKLGFIKNDVDFKTKVQQSDIKETVQETYQDPNFSRKIKEFLNK